MCLWRTSRYIRTTLYIIISESRGKRDELNNYPLLLFHLLLFSPLNTFSICLSKRHAANTTINQRHTIKMHTPFYKLVFVFLTCFFFLLTYLTLKLLQRPKRTVVHSWLLIIYYIHARYIVLLLNMFMHVFSINSSRPHNQYLYIRLRLYVRYHEYMHTYIYHKYKHGVGRPKKVKCF